MIKPLHLVLVSSLALGFIGCAITDPTDQDTARVQSAVASDPEIPIDAIALELGVSEFAVVRALPKNYARPWEGSPVQAWSAVQEWPVVHLRAEGVSFLGKPGLIQIDPQGDIPLGDGAMHVKIDWQDVQDVWLIRKPARYGDLLALQWFNDSGEVVMQARVPGAGGDASATRFETLWDAAE